LVRFLTYTEIDKKKWDACIEHSTSDLIYAYSFYLDIACPNWAALVKDDYSAVMPLPIRKKWGVSYVFTPFFIQQLGVFSDQAIPLEEFLAALPHTFKLIEYNLNWKNQDLSDFPIHWVTHHLNLGKSYAEIASAYDRTLKNNLKRAVQSGLKVEERGSIVDIIDLFKTDKGKDLAKIQAGDYKRLEKLAISCFEKRQGCFWEARENGTLLAGALFVWSDRHFIFLFSGNTARGKEVGALPFLLDSFIQSKAGEAGIFDFEGSNNLNLARFYKSFGSEKVLYPRLAIKRFPLNLFK
jgi:hypothetical protein